MTYTELIESAYKTQCEFHIGKNKTYGDSCFKTNIFGQLPEEAILARIADKIERIKFITSGGDAGGETLDDAIRDLIGYLVALQIVRDEAKRKAALCVIDDTAKAHGAQKQTSDMVRNFCLFLAAHGVIGPMEIQELKGTFIARWEKYKSVNVHSHCVFIGPNNYGWHQTIEPGFELKSGAENDATAAAIKAHITTNELQGMDSPEMMCAQDGANETIAEFNAAVNERGT